MDKKTEVQGSQPEYPRLAEIIRSCECWDRHQRRRAEGPDPDAVVHCLYSQLL